MGCKLWTCHGTWPELALASLHFWDLELSCPPSFLNQTTRSNLTVTTGTFTRKLDSMDSVLKLESKNLLPKPAKSIDDCTIVRPSSLHERAEWERNWRGSEEDNIRSNKRQRCMLFQLDEKQQQRQAGEGGKGEESATFATRQQSGSSSFADALKIFLSSGCCAIPEVLPHDFVTKSKSKLASDLEYLSLELRNRGSEAVEHNQEHLMARVLRADFRELVDRDGGRRDIRFQLDRFPFTTPGLVYNPIVYPLVRELLGGGDVTLLYAGVMWALPQPTPKKTSIDSASQKWHSDGGHLFDHVHLPPHCINVFYPLVDVSSENGPTEVMTGTHRLGLQNNPSATAIKLCCKAGSAILFDYRLYHRGAANFTSEPRPVMYLCYARSHFRDAGNTRSDQSIISQQSSPSESRRVSPPWIARILTGGPMRIGQEGFKECAAAPGASLKGNIEKNETIATSSTTTTSSRTDRTEKVDATASASLSNADGSGERSILFKMNIELPGSFEPKVITVYRGDVSEELSSQFCRENCLGDEFVPVLSDMILSQINNC